MFLMFLTLILIVSTIGLFLVSWDDEKEIFWGEAIIARDAMGRIVSTTDANGLAIINEVYYDDAGTQPILITALSCVHIVRVANNRYVRVFLDGISRREAMDVHLDQKCGDFTWTSDFIDYETLRLYRQRMVWGIDTFKHTRLAMEGGPCLQKRQLKLLSSSVMLNTRRKTQLRDIRLAS